MRRGGGIGRAGVQACNFTVVAERLLDPSFKHVCGNAHPHTCCALREEVGIG